MFRKQGMQCVQELYSRTQDRSGVQAYANGSLHGGAFACALMCDVLVRP